MFEVAVEQTFAAGHALRGYKGKCENVHGHNYRVRVTLEGERLNSIGLLVDFVEVKRLMRAAVDYLDHKFVNDLPPFDTINPSAENMARFFYDEVQKGLAASGDVPARIQQVQVWETDTSVATYRP
ncbi:MAG: 6-carboxytetrahydropterin synthase QueD [Bryobacteraceae bacterium]|nr:6-carboxytetrahydropterin synthase QueD [Bryobacteraceae bacterium]